MYAALLGDLDGVRLITEERLREATTLSMSGMDAVFGMPSAWALGYAIGRPGSSPEGAPTAFGVGGAGGSFAYGETASGIAFGLTKNRLTNDFNSATEIVQIVTEATGR
jgi:CubicO group peptidase (beta-lactamase class C family)